MAGSERRRWGRRRLGLRREVLILLPVALLLLVVVSLFTLAAYRGLLESLLENRREEAARQAATAARALEPEVPVTAARLRALAPQVAGVALLDAEGWPLVVAGNVPMGNLLQPHPLTPAAVAALPPASGSSDPTGSGGRFLRVDLDAGVLGTRLRSRTALTVTVVGVNVAVVLLVLLFLRHLLAPYETLIQGVRRIQPDGEGNGEDVEEVEDLLATFERAMTTLSRSQERTAEDDIAVLERTLTANLESGLLLLDREGRVLALNAVGGELLGIDAPATGTPVAEALGDTETAGPLTALLAEAVAQGQAIPRREVPWRRQDSQRTLGLTAHLLRRDDGGVRGFLVLFADLTELQRQAEQERLEESLAQLGELAGGVAHELRNSLATLKGYLTLIEREPEEETIADYLGEIRHETDHLQRVLEDFLAFARPGSVRLQPLALETVVRRAAADPLLAGTPVEVRVEPDLATLIGDPQLLERAVRNLLHNAAKAQKEAGVEGAVEVSLTSSGSAAETAPERESIVLTVADRGPGVPPEIRERLFQPFAAGFRDGVGLGLALAHRILALHRGRLDLEPREGGGTEARAELPTGTIVTERNKSSRSPNASPASPQPGSSGQAF